MSRGARISGADETSRTFYEAGMKTLHGVMQHCLSIDVDLLDTDDNDAEKEYLRNAERSYKRTVSDIVSGFAPRIQVGEKIRILEIGSYLGVISITFARLGFSVTALDIPEFISNPRLSALLAQEKVVPVAANLKDGVLPFPERAFDMVIMCETLEHLNFNPLPLLFEINRVLEPAGMLYLSLPNLASLVNRVKLLCGVSIHNPISDFASQVSGQGNMIAGIHWREYTRKEIVELLGITGFRIERHYCFTTNRASLPARLIYLLFPSLQGNQTTLAVKESFSASFQPEGRG